MSTKVSREPWFQQMSVVIHEIGDENVKHARAVMAFTTPNNKNASYFSTSQLVRNCLAQLDIQVNWQLLAKGANKFGRNTVGKWFGPPNNHSEVVHYTLDTNNTYNKLYIWIIKIIDKYRATIQPHSFQYTPCYIIHTPISGRQLCRTCPNNARTFYSTRK